MGSSLGQGERLVAEEGVLDGTVARKPCTRMQVLRLVGYDQLPVPSL
jgi:hypothetical protein